MTALRLDDPIELTRQLCDIPSVSDDEREIADAVEASVSGLRHLTVGRDGDTVVAATHAGRPQRVVIAGHLDTVPINGNVPSHLEQRDGEQWLVGRGAVDMKGGVAVQLSSAAALTAPALDVTWIWYDHEEVDAAANGLGRVAQTHPDWLVGDFAILGEPTQARIEGGCNGTCRFWITVPGVRAHSARPWMGKNAIHAAADVLERARSFDAQTVTVDGLGYREALNAVEISGGIAGNVIPDECRIHFNYRFAPSRTAAEAEVLMRETFAGYEITMVDMSPGARPGLDAPLVRQFVAATGGPVAPKYGWTDVARFAQLGIPAVNYGPGDARFAHADDEAVLTSEITACAEGLQRWLGGR
ncbi:MAG: succinyl-diaminopimelate desuccinylase [Pseudoclavibacter sp.]